MRVINDIFAQAGGVVGNTVDKKRKEAFDKLEELQKEYEKQTLAESKPLNLERLSYTAPSDDELYAAAERSLAEKYSAQKDKAKQTAADKRKSFEAALNALFEDAETEKTKVDQEFADAVKKTENSALKRGVARSSMAQGAINELIKGALEQKIAIDNKTQNKKNEIDSGTAALENELAAALETLDRKQRDDVLSAFDKLKKESDERAEEVKKYNNSLEEKEKNYALKTYDVKTQEEFEKVKDDYDNKKLAVALDYYLSIDDKQKALADFANNEKMKDYLGNYYDYMMNIMKVRAR